MLRPWRGRAFEDFGFAELRIPILEKTELFARSIGANTDIVEKEMYTFSDRKGELLTLRPEATASVVRAYIEHKLYANDPVRKLFTIGPMFRRERPQKGRYRQFYQINAEVFRLPRSQGGCRTVALFDRLFGSAGTLWCFASHQLAGLSGLPSRLSESTLTSFLSGRSGDLCSDCLRRREKNPLRIFDCKVPTCKESMVDAPSILDHLCEPCRDHFDTVQRAPRYLFHQRIRPTTDWSEAWITTPERLLKCLPASLGAQNAVAGGGRYDGLVKALGGPDHPVSALPLAWID